MAGPTINDFTAFLRSPVGIDPLFLPDTDPVISTAYTVAISLVNQALMIPSQNLYNFAVYNLGADFVINWANDQPNRTFFYDLRKSLNIELFVPGVVSSSGDQGTSASRLNPEFMKNYTMRDLQNLKTPYGRAYLAIAQDYGTLWGMT